MKRPLRERMRRAWREMAGPWSATDPNFPLARPGGGGDLTRLVLDWVASCMSPDDEVRGSAKRLRARARDLEKGNSYAESYLGLLGANVIGPQGFKHQAVVRDNSGNLNKRINDGIEEAWEDWSGGVTLDGRLDLVEFSSLLLRTVARDGEAFVRKWRGPDFPHGFALEPVDADLVDETYSRANVAGVDEVRLGVGVDRYGRPTTYHIWTGAYTMSGAREREAVPASDIIHLYRPKRVNQVRGVTWFGPAMIALKMLDGYEEAELVAARIAASKMGFFQSQPNAQTPGEFAGDEEGEPNKRLTMDANPGTAEQLPVGWEFKEWSPDHPTAQFPAFVKNVLRKVATAMGVSYNALASDLEGVNYSSMRSGLLIERETWRILQRWWTRAFLRKVYREWMPQSNLSGELRLDSREWRKFEAVKFVPRGWPWVDPLKDVQAATLAIQNGMGSRTRYLAEQGEDFEETLEELAAETALAEQMGVEIEKVAAPPSAFTDPDNPGDGGGDGGDGGSGEEVDGAGGGGNGRARAEVLRAMRR